MGRKSSAVVCSRNAVALLLLLLQFIFVLFISSIYFCYLFRVEVVCIGGTGEAVGQLGQLVSI